MIFPINALSILSKPNLLTLIYLFPIIDINQSSIFNLSKRRGSTARKIDFHFLDSRCLPALRLKHHRKNNDEANWINLFWVRGAWAFLPPRYLESICPNVSTLFYFYSVWCWWEALIMLRQQAVNKKKHIAPNACVIKKTPN